MSVAGHDRLVARCVAASCSRTSPSGSVSGVGTPASSSTSCSSLTEQELLRCGEFVLPGIAKLVVQKRERRTGRNPATGASVEIPAKQVVKARIAKPLKDVVEA